LFTQMDGVGCHSCRWTALIVNEWVSTWMDRVCPCSCRWMGWIIVHADGQGGSSFTQMDCVGCHPQVSVDVDGWGLLSFRQIDVVGRLSREWTGLGVDADGQGLLSFMKMDGIGCLHAVGCGSWVGINADGWVCHCSCGGTALGSFHVDVTMLEDGGRSTWSTGGWLWVLFRQLQRHWRPGGY